MRASELLASVVIDASGRSLGPVRDVRLDPRDHRVAGVVVGDGRLARVAHAWGFAEGRARGPAPLRALLAPASARARFVASESVVDWGPGVIRIGVDGRELPRLAEETGR